MYDVADISVQQKYLFYYGKVIFRSTRFDAIRPRMNEHRTRSIRLAFLFSFNFLWLYDYGIPKLSLHAIQKIHNDFEIRSVKHTKAADRRAARQTHELNDTGTSTNAA